jgi:hypothetical protein
VVTFETSAETVTPLLARSYLIPNGRVKQTKLPTTASTLGVLKLKTTLVEPLRPVDVAVTAVRSNAGVALTQAVSAATTVSTTQPSSCNTVTFVLLFKPT